MMVTKLMVIMMMTLMVARITGLTPVLDWKVAVHNDDATDGLVFANTNTNTNILLTLAPGLEAD